MDNLSYNMITLALVGEIFARLIEDETPIVTECESIENGEMKFYQLRAVELTEEEHSQIRKDFPGLMTTDEIQKRKDLSDNAGNN